MVIAFVGENTVYVEHVKEEETIQCVVFLHYIYKVAINCVKVRNHFSFMCRKVSFRSNFLNSVSKEKSY